MTNRIVLLAGGLVVIVFVIGFVGINPVSAQEEATSSDPVSTSSEPVDGVSDSITATTTETETVVAAGDTGTSESSTESATTPESTEPAAEVSDTTATDGTTETIMTDSEQTDMTPTHTEEAASAITETPLESESTEADVSTDGQVEVQLLCSQSYTGPLYDTPSGHLDAGYFVGTESASTTGMTAAQIIGDQAWTICHDARGHEHEFKLTAEEYAALRVRGTPERSVMESPEEAALDSF